MDLERGISYAFPLSPKPEETRLPTSSARKYDLVCFDVDGTLITHPSGKVIWEILNLKYTGDDTVNRERLAMSCIPI